MWIGVIVSKSLRNTPQTIQAGEVVTKNKNTLYNIVSTRTQLQRVIAIIIATASNNRRRGGF